MVRLRFDIILPEVGQPEIEVATACGSIDLHNFAEFVGYEYRLEGSSFEMRWVLDDETALLSGRRVHNAILAFDAVDHLTVSPRDRSMPVREDATLDDYRLLESKTGTVHLVFTFRGGVRIEVSARDVALWVQ